MAVFMSYMDKFEDDGKGRLDSIFFWDVVDMNGIEIKLPTVEAVSTTGVGELYHGTICRVHFKD